jgi:hypothetical protein
MGYLVIDNFLDEESFKKVQDAFYYSESCPWYFAEDTVEEKYRSEGDSDYPQFSHTLAIHDGKNTNYQLDWVHSGPNYIYDLLNRINPSVILRIKLNRQFLKKVQQPNAFHKDNLYYSDNKIQYTVGIFYLNTCDGFTKFKDGTQISSVENRMLFFSGDTSHTGCPPTEGTRVVMNFNFINAETYKLYEKNEV